MLLKGKKGLIMGVANDRSLATGIAKKLFQEGATIGFSHLPDDKGKMKDRCEKAIADCNPAFIYPCDVNNDESLNAFFELVKKDFGTIDFLVHSIAFAPLEDIRCQTVQASRQGFLNAMETSCYSFMATSRLAAPMMTTGGSIITLSYLGGERVMPGYNLMGVAKAALECAVRYVASDLGPSGIRVNGVSPGPIRTLAASAVGDFSASLTKHAAAAPLRQNANQEDVGRTACYLLSDLASSVTGELIHVDGGYHVMGIA